MSDIDCYNFSGRCKACYAQKYQFSPEHIGCARPGRCNDCGAYTSKRGSYKNEFKQWWLEVRTLAARFGMDKYMDLTKPSLYREYFDDGDSPYQVLTTEAGRRGKT